MITFVYLDAEEWNRPNIYFSLAELLVPCGRRFDLGLALRRWILTFLLINLSSLLIQQVVSERFGPLCNSFD
jgi:hypothetical protein